MVGELKQTKKIDNGSRLIGLYVEEFLVNNIQMFTDNLILTYFMMTTLLVNFQREATTFSELYKSTLIKRLQNIPRKLNL